MVNTGELEIYLNDKSAKENDVVEILSGAKIVEQTFEGKTSNVLHVPTRLNGAKVLDWTPGKSARTIIEDKFGQDTEQWAGHKFSVKFVLQMIKGKEKNVIKPVIIS